MSKEKNKLLISSMLMIFSIILSILSIKKISNIELIINIVGYVLGIIGSIYFIYLYNKNIDLKNKYKIIFIISLIFFFNNIISGIIGFSIYSKIKPKRKEIKRLEDIKEYNKYIYLVAFLIFLFISFFYIKVINNMYIKFIIYLLIFIIYLFLFKDRLKRDFKCYKKYFREYNFLVLKLWGISFLISLFLSIIIKSFTNINSPTNQIAVQENFYRYPFIVAFLSIIYAPILEELVFRGCLKKFINNKYLFIIISGILFGSLHVIDDFKSYEELLYILLYSNIGIILAYLYDKTNNIITNISFHFIQNLFSILGMIIIYFFK